MGLLDILIHVSGGGLNSRNRVRRRPHLNRQKGGWDGCMKEIREKYLDDGMYKDEAETNASIA